MPDADQHSHARPKGRGATGNVPNRYHERTTERCDDGWHQEDLPPLRTSLGVDRARSAISWNDSPDIPFDRSVNPYRGCEHGCIYCYARPSHAWLDLSPGLDFESRLFYKPDLPERLREALSAKSYKPAPMAIGSITDAYQPIEREQGLTRQIIEILCESRHPFAVITKSALIERDLDLIGAAAQAGIAQVAVSLTTLQPALARQMEPRAATPIRRLKVIERLAERGIPVRLMVAPIVPVLTDHELETLMRAGREAGASAACYVLLRLPRELSSLFRQWLQEVAPDSFDHVMNRLREAHGDHDYDSEFGHRMTGTGVYADLLAQRFDLACRRLGLQHGIPDLRSDRFDAAALHGQLSLF
ncbi:PA0069 family radical SAM protein [Thiorhodococcus mannitoliphagus]|uniref:PA0069 family radical SAM protein n=1 Tax=Thiorhodococcus mannitoliphagus TaxID=329406 RepID=A0A6P1DS02_9GAMM|nr:PA0069 family radical SAM protein [Thiorhodococcus mannitoliphagus]NEX20828.1 PA0069 family radical SAM protein [Thiorhodococcus mannitoliphagus]